METYLLVDGYNIINAWPELLRLMEDCIEDARDRLIHLLNNYAGFKACKIIVVFDGHMVKDNRGERYLDNKVEVVFSPWGISADQIIEKEVGLLLKGARREKVLKNLPRGQVESQPHSASCQVFVATSDKLQQEIIWTKGAYRVSAPELLAEVEKANKEHKEIFDLKNPSRRNYLEANLDCKVRSQLEKIRRS